MSKRAVGVLNGNWKGQWREEKQNLTDQYWQDQERDWMGKCAEVEGAESFRAWYESDQNVPAYGQASERVKLLIAHYNVLRTTHPDAFYWLQVEEQVAQDCMKIEGRQSFIEWWESPEFPANATPKDRVELIRNRINNFLKNDGTTQVQARVKVLEGALSKREVRNRKEVIKELASLVNHIQSVGAPVEGEG